MDARSHQLCYFNAHGYKLKILSKLFIQVRITPKENSVRLFFIFKTFYLSVYFVFYFIAFGLLQFFIYLFHIYIVESDKP
jgi:hypothetical protein